MPPRSSLKRKKSRAAVTDNGNNNRKKFQSLVPYLHHDIWFEILTWLSATCLYDIMSRVSNTWANMISHPCFVHTHLRRSRSGLYVQGLIDRFLEIVNDSVQVTYYKPKSQGSLYFSYQGVCLFNNYSTKASSVVNPVTMQIHEISAPVLVPGYRCTYTGRRNPDVTNFSVIRDRCSGELKLVFAIQEFSGVCSWYVQKLGIENSWKKIGPSQKFYQMDCPGLSIGGFLVYQVCDGILAFDVSDETIHSICRPKLEHCRETFLEMENNLSCISRNSERIFIHILKDFHAGEWILYHILDYGYIPGKPLERQRFLGWINNGEELFVRLCTFENCLKIGSCYEGSYYEDHCHKLNARYRVLTEDKWIYCTYNLKTKRTTYLDKYISESDLVRVHTNSLISWKPLKHED